MGLLVKYISLMSMMQPAAIFLFHTKVLPAETIDPQLQLTAMLTALHQSVWIKMEYLILGHVLFVGFLFPLKMRMAALYSP